MVKVSLGDFVKYLVASLHKQKVKIPFENESPWHELFYDLKQNPGLERKLSFFQDLWFDWDGPYPKSPELSEFLHALHWNACVSANNPVFDVITLPDDEIANLWLKTVEESGFEEKDFMIAAIEKAKAKFSQEIVPY
jgi:hypothetical protein